MGGGSKTVFRLPTGKNNKRNSMDQEQFINLYVRSEITIPQIPMINSVKIVNCGALSDQYCQFYIRPT
uniref:Uncharacterized protein n=1 Tax=Caenorhabditis japonica TaxID=281687 RepID=A0A8R1IRI6_CAEJA